MKPSTGIFVKNNIPKSKNLTHVSKLVSGKTCGGRWRKISKLLITMKSLIATMALITTMSIAVYAQDGEKAKSKSDFVYELPQMDMLKRLPTLKSYLNVMEGVEFKGYCESRKLLMLKMDPWKTEQVTDLFEQMELTYMKKENATIEQAINECENKKEIEYSNSIQSK